MNAPVKIISQQKDKPLWACHCCGFDNHSPFLDEHLASVGNVAYLKYKKPITVVVHSCCDCGRKTVRDKTSQHLKGLAVDFHLAIDGKKLSTNETIKLVECVEAFRLGGIGSYKWGVHADIRNSGQARWKG